MCGFSITKKKGRIRPSTVLILLELKAAHFFFIFLLIVIFSLFFGAHFMFLFIMIVSFHMNRIVKVCFTFTVHSVTVTNI